MAGTNGGVSGGGFGDEVFDSQAVFRETMRALAHPGTIVDLGRRLDGPHHLEPAASAILLALADYETPVWLDEPLRNSSDVVGWIGFRTGAVILREPARARFAVVSKGGEMPNLSEFELGCADYPDRSTTLLLACAALEGGVPLDLAGPGIETVCRIAPRDLSPVFLADWAINRALFPRGIDVVLVSGSRAIGLPRTTQIRSA